MIEWFLFDGIDAESARAAIGEQPHLALLDAAHEAQPALAFVHFAGTRADVALHTTV